MSSIAKALPGAAFSFVRADLWIAAALLSSLVFIGLIAVPARSASSAEYSGDR